jgi:WD40 repeat protein
VWDITIGALLHSLEGHIVPVSKMILLPRPGCFVTAGGQQLNVWHLDRGENIAQFTTDGEIHSCVVAPDGTIIVGDGLGRVHFLNLVEPT